MTKGNKKDTSGKGKSTLSGSEFLPSRRSFCMGAGSLAVLLGLGSLSFIEADPLMRPPGGQNEDQLIAKCIRCQRCYQVCPQHVIKPAHLENGVLNMQTPTFDFNESYCTWCVEENDGKPLCVAVCSSDALKLAPDATPENTILGKAVIQEDWCLAYKLTSCRFCFDACPYEAMKLDKDNRPHVISELCNGCGACESVCVSLQSAVVTSNLTERAIKIWAINNNGEAVIPSNYASRVKEK